MSAADVLFQDDTLVVEMADGTVTMRCPGQSSGLSFPVESFAAVVAGAIKALDRSVEAGNSADQ